MTAKPNACTLCGGAGEQQNPLVPDYYHDDVQLHLHCLNSAAGREWMRSRAAADAGYARYLSLSTLAQATPCASCGKEARLSPKAVGMSAGRWELNCTSCYRHRPLLNGYRSSVEATCVRRLELLGQQFGRGVDVAAVLREVDTLAAEIDAALPDESCECGSRFSLAARPRCAACGHVIIDSPFHFAHDTPARNRSPA